MKKTITITLEGSKLEVERAIINLHTALATRVEYYERVIADERIELEKLEIAGAEYMGSTLNAWEKTHDVLVSIRNQIAEQM